MKRLICFLIIFLQTCLFVYADNITFLKEDYELQFVHKYSPNYMNEYVRPSQNLENWTNLITVNYFPKQKNEFDYLNNFINTVSKSPNMYIIKIFPNMNLFSFGIITKDYIEYNVLRTEIAEEGGVKTLQFGHKYKFKDKEEFTQAYERSQKYNMKYVNGLLNTPMPKIEKKNYEKK